MRRWLLRIIEKIHIWLIPRNEIKPHGFQILPIFKCVPFKTGMNEDDVKRVLMNKLTTDLIQYVDFNKEVQGTGVTLLTARLDIVRKNKEKK